MRSLIVASLLLLATRAHAHTASVHTPAPFSLGINLSVPEIFGGYASFWPNDDVSLDVRATLSSIEGGVSGHLPIAASANGRHDIVLTGMGGYAHHRVRAGSYADDVVTGGPRFIAGAGYGHQGSWDIRMMGGLTGYEATGWHLDPSFWFLLGKFF